VKQIKYVALYGVIFGVGLWSIANLAMFVGLPAGLASLLLQFSAFFTIILSIIFFKEKIQLIQYIGMMLAIFGLVFIVYSSNGEFSIQGVALIIVAAFSWSICNIIVKKHKPNQMMSFIIWSSIFSAIPLFIITYIIKGNAPFLNLGNSLTIV
jgi:O-acetylserine/cysteine efflux transporter